MNGTRRRLAVLLGTLVSVGAWSVPVAAASPPSNDGEASATQVGGVPFQASADTSEAAPGGPRFCSNSASVFFRFEPAADVHVQIDTLGSEYDTTLGVYTRDADGTVEPIACSNNRIGWAAGIRLQAEAGTTYFLMVGECCRSGRTGGGDLELAVTEVVAGPLEVALEITDRGTVDPATGIATLSGVATCSKRSILYAEGTLRQLRQGMFVARGYWWMTPLCGPGLPAEWSVEVDTDSSIAFGAGTATFERWYVDAYAGWKEGESDWEDVTVTITLA